MTETIYNVFLIWDQDICNSVRHVSHAVNLSDKEAIKYLQDRVHVDLNTSEVYRLRNSFSRDEYNARTRLGHGHLLYEEVFELLGAGAQPLSVVTLVVNGVAQTHWQAQLGDPNIYLRPEMMDGAVMDDWLLRYRVGDSIDLSALINDDYFLAIKLTFNAKHYVSAMKLLLSAIDSWAFLEFGDGTKGTTIFERWLDEYADLRELRISSKELWELRNGLLHMSNLHSRQVNKKAVRQISFTVGGSAFHQKDGIHYFSFHGLINVVAVALVRWLETYNRYPEKRVQFVDRFDKTVSDSRQCVIKPGPKLLAKQGSV